MTYLSTDADGDTRPVTPAPAKQFVVYPLEGPIDVQPDGRQEYRLNPSCYPTPFGAPLWVEVQALLPDEIEVQRDGSIQLHFSPSEESADIVVVPRSLASFVRVFTAQDEAVRHAQQQNTQLTELHERWANYARRFKLELEARYGRAAVPNPLVYRVSLGQGSQRATHVMDAASLIGRIQQQLRAAQQGAPPDGLANELADFATAERLP